MPVSKWCLSKRVRLDPFSGEPALLPQPSLDDIGAVFFFPLFQNSVVSALCFDDFFGLRVFVGRELAWFACAGGLSCDFATGCGMLIR